MSIFPDSVRRPLNQKMGEIPSVLDFIPTSQHGAVRDGSSTTDVTGWIQDGLNSLETAGGGILYLPWGVYPVVDIDLPSNVTLVGDGPAKTILKRRANLPTGRGVLNIAGVNSGFEALAIDGQVTTPQVALYSSLSDPSSAALTANSSVRIHPGAKDVSLRRFRIFHSGGYAVHIDARTGDVYRVEIDEPNLHDNRSWLFGAVSGSEIYGSWTGGILAQGDGLSNNYAVRGLKVTGGKFRRGTGNQIWSHVYGFGTLHSDFRIQGNSFEDIGRDGIMIGAVVGGDVSGNNFRRIGYVALDDTNPAVPRWINGQWAVGLDTAGLTRGVNYRGNTFINCYGAAMDLDGFAEGVVSDNTVIVSQAGEPEYSEDSVASWAGNYCYGAQVSNTNDLAAAGVGVKVTGNRFRNCGLGAIRMYASRRGTVSGNTIEHPAGAAVAPIILGNVGAGDNKRAYGNTVTDNDVYYSPGSPVGVVQEDANGFNFASTDVNRVYGNRLHGTNTFEFFKHATSGSRTAQEFASAKAALTAESKNVIQREDGYWRGYWVEAGVSKAVFSLLDRVSLPGSTFGGPLWNISGNAVGGVITTGARTTSAFDDAVVSGKVYADGFLAVAATTFAGAEANLLPDTVGLIRYNATSKAFEQSTSVSAGARVWAPLSSSLWTQSGSDIYRATGKVTVGSATPASLFTVSAATNDGLTVTDGTQVGIYFPSSAGGPVIGSTSNHPLILYANNAGRVWVTPAGNTLFGTGTDDGSSARVQVSGFVRATTGFATPSANSDAIQAPAGGVTALSLISIRNDGAAGLTLARTSTTARTYGLGIDSGGALFLRDQTAAAVRLSMNSAGLVTIGAAVSIDQVGNVSASATVAAAGVNVSGTSFNSLQVPSGGVYAGLGATLDQAVYLKTFAATPNNPGAGYGGWSHRSGATYLYWNGTAWATVDLTSIGAGVTSLTGTANQVSVSAATGAVTLSLPQNIHTGAAPTFAGVTLTSSAIMNVSTNQGISISNGTIAGIYFASGLGGMAFGSTSTGGGGHPVIFLTNNTDRGRITAGGNWLFGSSADDASGARVQVSGFVRATTGFATPSTNSDAIQAPGGGVTALSLISVRNDGGAGLTLSRTSSTARTYQFGINSGGEMFLFDGTAGAVRLTLTTAGVFNFGTTVAINQAGAITASGVVQAGGVNVVAGAPAFNSLQSNGGVYAALGATLDQAVYLKTFAGSPNSPGAGYGALSHRSGSTYLYWNGSAWATVDLASTGGGVTSLTGTANQVNVSASTGAVTLSLPQNIHTGAAPTFAGGTFTSTVLLNVSTNQGINISDGVYTGLWYASGLGGIVFGSTSAHPLIFFGGNSDRGRITAAGNWLFGTGTDDSSGARVQVSGFVRATTGFATPSTATDALQATAGGVTAKFLIGTTSFTLVGDSAANAGLSGSGQGRIYYDSTSNRFRVSQNGGAYVDLVGSGGITSINSLAGPALTIAAGTAISVTPSGSTITIANTGVTALSGTANQVNVSASTGSVTLSLPQAIHTGASPTFAGVTAGAFSATATGSSIAFQTSNFNFQVDGNGVVSSAGGINVTGVNVINTSRQFVGAGVNVGSNGISAGGYNINGGFSGQTWNIGINGGGTFNINGAGSYTNIQFRGGVITGAT